MESYGKDILIENNKKLFEATSAIRSIKGEIENQVRWLITNKYRDREFNVGNQKMIITNVKTYLDTDMLICSITIILRSSKTGETSKEKTFFRKMKGSIANTNFDTSYHEDTKAWELYNKYMHVNYYKISLDECFDDINLETN
jgi:hypothetical protein